MAANDADRGPRSDPAKTSGGLRYAGMGVELGGAIVGFTLLGYGIDWKFGTAPKGVAIGAILGILGGLYNFFRHAIRLTREQYGAQSLGGAPPGASAADADRDAAEETRRGADHETDADADTKL